MHDDLKNSYQQIITAVGEDPAREGLLDTPKRAAKAMEYLTKGYRQTLDEITNNAVFTSDADDMVLIQDIELYSMCEHHLLPFVGRCHIAYIPNGKVLGLSKFARIVDMYARRFQIQEQLTHQIAKAVEEVTGAKGVGVIIEAKSTQFLVALHCKTAHSQRASENCGSYRHQAELEGLKRVLLQST